MYQYEDKDGTVIFTDRPENVPEKQRENRRESIDSSTSTGSETSVKTGRQNRNLTTEPDSCNQVEESLAFCKRSLHSTASERPKEIGENELIYMNYNVCSNPLLQKRLTVQERVLVRELQYKSIEAEKHISPKKLYEAKMFIRMVSAGCEKNEVEKVYSRQELDDLGTQLSRIWKEMSAALAANDIKRAVRYYHEMVQENWQKQYSSYPKNELRKIAKEMLNDQLYVERVEDNARAVCHLLTTRDGTKYSFQLIFLKGADNEWKIQSF